jgi:hypothetical protein
MGPRFRSHAAMARGALRARATHEWAPRHKALASIMDPFIGASIELCSVLTCSPAVDELANCQDRDPEGARASPGRDRLDENTASYKRALSVCTHRPHPRWAARSPWQALDGAETARVLHAHPNTTMHAGSWNRACSLGSWKVHEKVETTLRCCVGVAVHEESVRW